MKFIPTLFGTPMVQSLLANRKTKTRRIITERNSDCTALLKDLDFNDVITCTEPNCIPFEYLKVAQPADGTRHRIFPKVEPEDVLWVRETWQQEAIRQQLTGWDAFISTGKFVYKADGYTLPLKEDTVAFSKWRPSIFMPKEACRIFLKVLSVKAEQVQDVLRDDVYAEGLIPVQSCTDFEVKKHFEKLWIAINGAASWNRNDWVWIYEFSRLQENSVILIDNEFKMAA